jgi:hypothetical protein
LPPPEVTLNAVNSAFFSQFILISFNSTDAMLMQYYHTKNLTLPTGNGLIAGTFLDGQPLYVGCPYLLNFGVCNNGDYTPGRISMVPGKAGVYYDCGKELFASEYVYYYRDHISLWWAPANSTSINGNFSVLQTSYHYTGRINLTSSNGVQYTQIGRVVIGQTDGLHYIDENVKSVTATKGYEVLMCGY